MPNESSNYKRAIKKHAITEKSNKICAETRLLTEQDKILLKLQIGFFKYP